VSNIEGGGVEGRGRCKGKYNYRTIEGKSDIPVNCVAIDL
jgi:hypothetical protein